MKILFSSKLPLSVYLIFVAVIISNVIAAVFILERLS